MKRCRHCGHLVAPWSEGDYSYICPICDEQQYIIEVDDAIEPVSPEERKEFCVALRDWLKHIELDTMVRAGLTVRDIAEVVYGIRED